MNGTRENPANAHASAPDEPTPAGGAAPAHASAPADSRAVTPSPPVGPQAARVADHRAKSPVLACFLSLMPGLGQVYVGYYQRGFLHVLVFAGLITILAASNIDELAPLGGIFLAFFYLYNIIDAGRRAAFYNQVLAGQPGVTLPQDFEMPRLGGSIAGGLALIGGGLVLLLHTRFDVSLDWIEEWWPLAPILLGVYLLGRALRERMEP